MKFKLEIIDSKEGFTVRVLDGPKIVARTGWHGGEFKYRNVQYAVYGPYHSLDGDHFRVYQLTPVSEIL